MTMTTSAKSSLSNSEVSDRQRERATVGGALLTVMVDNFDIVLPIIVLAPAVSYFYSTSWSLTTVALITSWVFVATLLGRPLGALIFGMLADRIGRRRTTIVAILGFGITTLLIGLLPGHSTWGLGAIAALITLRFVDGIFLGGGYTGASPLAMESSPVPRRGLYGGIIQTGNNVAFVLVALLTLLMLQIAPPGGPTSAYSIWGWRVPFFFSALLAAVLLTHYVRKVPESAAWTQAKERQSGRTAIVMLEPQNLRSLGQVFIWMTGIWLTLNSVIALLPATLSKTSKLAPASQTWVLVVLYLLAALMFPVLGGISQRMGRRPYMIASAVTCTILGGGAYFWLIHLGAAGTVQIGAVAVLTGLLVLAPAAIATVYISERFSTAARGTGFGLGYTLAIVIPSFYASYQQWLGHLMPPAYTVVALVAMGGLLQVLGALMGPETRNVVMGPSHPKSLAE